jgi:riboflavin kinase/FMN adenylyltransferase
LKLFESLGIDVGIILDFNRSFSLITADHFVRDVLARKIGARSVFVGENFRFGKHAHADSGTLKRLARFFGFHVKIFGTIRFKGKPVSSTVIRRLVAKGKFSEARTLLLRPVSVLGKVVKGESVAKGLGFPTANLRPDHEVLPPPGIYAAKALLKGRSLDAVAFIGKKYAPRHTAGKIVEVHIFSFKKNIYGKEMEVQFIRKIRDEKKFSSSEKLIKQIKKDVFSAKRTLSHHS